MRISQLITHSGTIGGNPEIEALISEIGDARTRYVSLAYRLSKRQVQYKPTPEAWNAVDITEHLVRAEQQALWEAWQALEAHQDGKTLYSGTYDNQGLAVEAIVARTVQLKQQVPANTLPQTGGTLAFWCASLLSLQLLLLTFGRRVRPNELGVILVPNPVFGLLNLEQQLELLRFNLAHYWRQIGTLFPDLDARR